MHQAASGVQFPSRKRTEIRQGPGRARPAWTFGASAATQIAPARPRCPTLLWDITITAPRAALAHENGLTAAANPWGCPLPGGGVRLPSSPAGGSPGRRRSRSSWWTRRATRATSGADFVSTHWNAQTPSFAVGAGQSQSGRSSPPRRSRSVACPRPLAKLWEEMDINALCFADTKASIRWPPPHNETRTTAPRAHPICDESAARRRAHGHRDLRDGQASPRLGSLSRRSPLNVWGS